MDYTLHGRSNGMNDKAKTAGVDGISSDERMWATLAHLSIVVVALVGPLVVWLVKKEESKFVEEQAKEALNFHITVFIASIVLMVTIIGPVIVGVAALVYGIIAGIEANKGICYRYPYTLRLVR
jgi:hypothetical protein